MCRCHVALQGADPWQADYPIGRTALHFAAANNQAGVLTAILTAPRVQTAMLDAKYPLVQKQAKLVK